MYIYKYMQVYLIYVLYIYTYIYFLCIGLRKEKVNISELKS